MRLLLNYLISSVSFNKISEKNDWEQNKVAAEINANKKTCRITCPGTGGESKDGNSMLSVNRLASCRRVIPLLETAYCHNSYTVMTSFPLKLDISETENILSINHSFSSI